MKEDKFDKLFKKYQEGKTTLKEENILFNKEQNSSPSLQAWFVYAKNNRIKMPKNLNDTLWDSFKIKLRSRRKFTFAIMSAAATIILFITFFIGYTNHNKLNYNEKKALLNQALNMFPDEKKTEFQHEIIYESNLIVIYTVSE